MKILNYDAVVVEAGPGGSIAAKCLAENGVDVLVVEKKLEKKPFLLEKESVSIPKENRFLDLRCN